MRLPDYVSSVILLSAIGIAQAVMAQATPPAGKAMSAAEVDELQAKAQAGDAVAQLNLGKAYEDGNGVRQSDEQAFKWYRASAEQGNAAAQNDVGVMFRLGRGVEKDKEEAVKWFRKAAKQENPNALFNLGAAYFNGDGVGIDDTAACAWFLLAQQFGSPQGADAAKRMKEDHPYSKVTLQEDALERIAEMYRMGDGLPKSPGKAIDWYRKGADLGSPQMQVKLAGLLILGNPSDKGSLDEAHRMCEKAAGAHFAAGAYCMGHLYQKGLGVESDAAKSAKWFREAAELGMAAGAWRLGQMYWNGEGLKQDKISAYEFMYIAAMSNLPEAKPEKEKMEKELTPKEMESAKAKAKGWSRQHRGGVVLKLK